MDGMEQRGSVLSVGCRVRMLAPASAWKEVVSLSRTFVQFEGQPPVGRRTLERLIASGQAEVEPRRTATVVVKDPGALGEVVTCPKCGAGDERIGPAIRQGHMAGLGELAILGRGPEGSIGLVDVGFHCQVCECRWGFEIFSDDYLDATADLQPDGPMEGLYHATDEAL